MQGWYTDVMINCGCCESCVKKLNQQLHSANITDRAHESCFFRIYYTVNAVRGSLPSGVYSPLKTPCETNKCRFNLDRSLQYNLSSEQNMNYSGYSNLKILHRFLSRSYAKKILAQPVYMHVQSFCNTGCMADLALVLNKVLAHVKNQLEEKELLLRTNTDWKVELVKNPAEHSEFKLYYEELDNGVKNVTLVDAEKLTLSTIKNLLDRGPAFF